VERFLASLGYLHGKCRVRPPRLPFVWRKPVFAGSLPTIRQTDWFKKIMGRFRGLDRRVYQLCFAPLTGRRYAALVALRPGVKVNRALARKVRRAVGDAFRETMNRFDPDRRLVISFTEFPYWHRPEPR